MVTLEPAPEGRRRGKGDRSHHRILRSARAAEPHSFGPGREPASRVPSSLVQALGATSSGSASRSRTSRKGTGDGTRAHAAWDRIGSPVPHWTRLKTLKTPDAFRAHLGSARGERCRWTTRWSTASRHRSRVPSRATDCARAIASASFRWKAGTERRRPPDRSHPPPVAALRQSGAKLIWGGEAVAVRPDGRANPNQLVIAEETVGDLEALRLGLVGRSSRAARPHRRPRRRPAVDALGAVRAAVARGPAPTDRVPAPVLDARLGIVSDEAVLADGELDALVDDFVEAARRRRARRVRLRGREALPRLPGARAV